MAFIGRLYQRIGEILTPSETGWRGAGIGLWILALCAYGLFVTGLLTPAPTVERALGFAVLTGMVVAVWLGAMAAMALLESLPRGFRRALFLAFTLTFLLAMVMWGASSGALMAGALVLAVSFLFGGLFALIGGQGRLVSAIAAGLGAVALVSAAVLFLIDQDDPNSAYAEYTLEDRTLPLPDPSAPGRYDVLQFSYGSGTDRHRADYGDVATWTSRSVDGSKLLDDWSWARTRYWGFDEKALPVQGRVWAPDGDGPFPLILIVHGNHAMEDYSDPGYAYLGEHLASRGYILVSVDENFLNGSMADTANPMTGGLEEENDARGWMLLEHLVQWREWARDPAHPLAGRVDMDRVGLIGHSRGGEAVAIAAAFNPLSAYPDDVSQAFDYGFNLRGIIAIAPVDGQYKPRDRGTLMEDVNYFVIHGGMDGDVSSFMGMSQYSRAVFSGEADRFKASLYVKDANHGQFNTGWGRLDAPPPFSFLLDTDPIMDGGDQRRIALVYFTAFWDITMNGRNAYRPLFADARRGAQWLPDGVYIANTHSSSDLWLADFEEDLDPSSASLEGAAITGTHLTRWKEAWIDLKWRPLETHGAVLAWNREVEEETASYAVTWPDGAVDLGERSVLRFSLAQAKVKTTPKGWEPDKEDRSDTDEQDAKDEPAPLDWTVIVTDRQGVSASLPLSHDLALYPQVLTYTRRLAFLETDEASEPVMRRYALPLARFAAANPALDPMRITKVTFRFDRSEEGAIILDDLGFSPDF